MLWHQLTSVFAEKSWRAADAFSKGHKYVGFVLCRKITIQRFDGNKKWALICKCRGKESPLPAHLHREKMSGPNRAWKNSTLQRPARRERPIFSPCTPFHLHNFLIGSTAVSRWTRCCLQTSATCTAVCRAVKQQHASRLVWSLFTRAGWEIKHIQHGLRSDWDERKWHQNHQAHELLTESASLTEQSIKMSPFYARFVLFFFKKHIYLYTNVLDKEDMLMANGARKIQFDFFFVWTEKKTLNRRLCIIPQECLRL